MTNSHVGPYVEANKHRHWFLCLSNAIYHDQKDPMQARMLAKLYAFMHDFLPDGFSGRWSHIKGEDVMSIIMSERKDMSVSRHKATQNAYALFEYLETWMEKGPDWRQAAERDAETSGKKRGPRKAPVLYTPAGLAALLSISYPDPKYRLWVGRLQIDWMMHDEIDVREGFWKGITKNDVDAIFQLPKTRYSEVPLVADYTRLFGPDFVSARKDIRPFLPPWAEELHLTLDETSVDAESEAEASGVAHGDEKRPSRVDQRGADVFNTGATAHKRSTATISLFANEDEDDDHDDESGLSDVDGWLGTEESPGHDNPGSHHNKSGDDDSIAVSSGDRVGSSSHTNGIMPGSRGGEACTPPLDMTKLLGSSPGADEAELSGWLSRRMDTWDEDEVLAVWCRSWVEITDAACCFEEQAVLRSLFLWSIRRVHSLAASSKTPAHVAFTDAFILLDAEDHQARQLPADAETLRQIRSIEQLPVYKPIIEAKAKLAHVARRGAPETVSEKQLAFFYDLFQHERFAKYIEAAVAVDAARMDSLRETTANTRPLTPINLRQTSPSRSVRVKVDDNIAGALKLTRWQLRVSAVSELDEKALTDWQARVYGRKFGAQRLADASTYGPVRAQDLPDSRDTDPKKREVLRKLFGDLHDPFVAAHGDDAWEHMHHPRPQVQNHNQARGNSSPQPRSSPRGSLPHTPIRPVGGDRPAVNGSSVTRPSSTSSTPWNPYAGLPSAKRVCSPDVRVAKIPRLTGPTVQESVEQLRADVTTASEKMQDELKTAVTASVETVLKSVEGTSTSGCVRVEKQLAETSQQAEENLNDGVNGLKAHISNSHAEIQTAIDSLGERMAQHEQQVDGRIQDLADTWGPRLERDNQALQAKMETLMSAVDELRQAWVAREEAQQVELQPGQEGYLTLHCPAPVGLDQKAYEQTLVRAGWYYVACFHHPDDGVDANADAFEYAMERFPSLNREHLATALNHVHQQGYGRLIERGS